MEKQLHASLIVNEKVSDRSLSALLLVLAIAENYIDPGEVLDDVDEEARDEESLP